MNGRKTVVLASPTEPFSATALFFITSHNEASFLKATKARQCVYNGLLSWGHFLLFFLLLLLQKRPFAAVITS